MPTAPSAAELPGWDDMTELDRGAALMHAWKRHWEGSAAYAVENYPCRYIEHPALIALGERESCGHAVEATGGWHKAVDSLGMDEVERLYNRALDEGSDILDSRKLWGARFESGNVATCDDESHARFLVDDQGWRACELLHRDEPGGAWTVIVDARGREEDCPIGRVRLGDQVLHDGTWTSAAADPAIVNEAVEGPFHDPGRHTFADVEAGHVFYHLVLADGSIIRERKRGVDRSAEATVRIRRRSADLATGAGR
jgi:hypothetical protein